MHRCLCLDGGGSKGFYTLGILQEIEAKHGPLSKYFNSVYGTSTGSIIAALIATNHSVAQIKKYYEDSVSEIMGCYTSRGRTKNLEYVAEKIFGKLSFENCSIDLVIVATNYDEKKPLIFKTNVELAHGSKSTFVPGFGCTLKDSVIASSSAYPLFKIKEVVTKMKGTIKAIDGGFTANNPTLIAYIDMSKKFQRDEYQILSLGVGKYPKSTMNRAITKLHLAPAMDLTETLFDSSAGITDAVFSLMAKDVNYLRVNGEYAEPTLACNLLENDNAKLGKLFTRGVTTYGQREKEITTFLTMP